MALDTGLARTRRAKDVTLPANGIALALFFLTLAVRLPFQSQTLNDWDSVNHALALTDFNVILHRPQPPGYILYIGVARLVNLIFPDPQTALVIVSMAASALAVSFLFLLGARMGTVRTGLIAALLLLTSPAFWFDGEVALPYVVEGACAIALALLLYRMQAGEQSLAPLAAVVFAISIGMRQQLALFFAPLMLYVFWKQSWRTRLEGGVWFGIVCLLWFVPLMLSAGGVNEYFTALRGLNRAFESEYVILGTGGLGAFVRNAARMGAYTAYALNFSLPVLALGAWHYVRAAPRDLVWKNARVRFLLLWIVPPVLFYLFFHMGSPGLIYVFLPALLLLTAFAVERLTQNVTIREAGLVAALGAVNVFLFLGTPPDLYTGRDIRVLNYSSMREHDQLLTAKVQAIQSNFKPQSTFIVADDWRFAEYYLPAYPILFVPPNRGDQLVLAQFKREIYPLVPATLAPLQAGTTLVFYDSLARTKYAGATTACLPVAFGDCLAYTQLAAGGKVTVNPNRLEVRAP